MMKVDKPCWIIHGNKCKVREYELQRSVAILSIVTRGNCTSHCALRFESASNALSRLYSLSLRSVICSLSLPIMLQTLCRDCTSYHGSMTQPSMVETALQTLCRDCTSYHPFM